MRTGAPRRLGLFLLLAVAAACAAGDAGLAAPRGRAARAAAGTPAAKAASRATVAPVPDSALGFVGASVFSVPVPTRYHANGSDPGERPRLPRAYRGSPPRIPHGVADFLPITPAENPCLGCHDGARAAESGAVAVPVSHYRDLRHSPEAVRKEVAGARYVCVSCHVPTTDAPILVGSRFGAPPRGR